VLVIFSVLLSNCLLLLCIVNGIMWFPLLLYLFLTNFNVVEEEEEDVKGDCDGGECVSGENLQRSNKR